ncbi:MAG: hypothetical protein E7426_09345 [Ruminococcaceae bacterium]|nr:hypothetical protein [Oscillospiraceae bacterium]
MSYSKDIFLGLDVGTTSVKAGFVDETGLGLFQATREYPTYPLGDSWVEQSADDWWEAATGAVRQLSGDHPELARCVRGISISCQAPTLLGIGRDGRPVGRGMIWMDQRAEDVCRELLQPHADYIHGFSGNRVDPYFALSKLLWQRRHEPEKYAATWKYLQINGYLVYRLTGLCSIDLSSAALTQTLNIRTLQTESPLFDLFELDQEKWPAVYGCGDIVGTVTPEAARLWGVPEDAVVLAGCIDGASSPLGLGVTQSGQLFEMSGQSSGIGLVLDEPSFHPNLCLMHHALPGTWLLKGSMSCSGGSLKWFRDNLDGAPGADFDVYNRLAVSSPPGAHGVTFLPYLCGERAPLWDRRLRGVYFGFGTDTTRADMVRAIMEGTAFALRTILDEFHDPAIHQKTILGTGGGYNSRIWSQIKSDILNCSIRVHQTSFDAALVGNALLVMRALGREPGQSLPEGGDAAVYTPDHALQELYEERYQFFRRLFLANKDLFV